MFDEATTENALLVFNQAVKDFGKPREMITDNGSQFSSNIFQQRLEDLKIKHIRTRVGHLQTNGKIERLFGTLKQLTKHFGSLEKAPLL